MGAPRWLEAKLEKRAKVMLAGTWDRLRDLAGWLASEKWDGVRAEWDPKLRAFVSREGNVYNAPDWFTADLPDVRLDGELWLGRGRFHECSGICRRALPRLGGHEWKPMRFLVFDAPDCPGILTVRLAVVKKAVAKCKYAQAVQQVTVPSNEVLLDLLKRVEKAGGEGLIARDPASRYERTRSEKMLKVITRIREEAKVIGYEEGERGCAGMMGALLIRLCKSGVDCKVGTGFTRKQRQAPPRIGAIVTIEHKGYQPDSGKPREPSFIGARNYE